MGRNGGQPAQSGYDIRALLHSIYDHRNLPKVSDPQNPPQGFTRHH